jgi:large subunit ribosomal protein L31
MKKDLHPSMKDVQATCVCGMKFNTRSTVGEIDVGICYKCHPFYTGQQKFVDTAGRIEKFNAKFKVSLADLVSKSSKQN